MSNFFSDYVEMNPLKTADAQIPLQRRPCAARTVPRFACFVVVNLDLQDYTPPG
jgi:hypothetical protein